MELPIGVVGAIVAFPAGCIDELGSGAEDACEFGALVSWVFGACEAVALVVGPLVADTTGAFVAGACTAGASGLSSKLCKFFSKNF